MNIMKIKPRQLELEARVFDSTDLHDQLELAEWCGGQLRGIRLLPEQRVIQIYVREADAEYEANFGDYIIKGLNNIFWPVRAKEFNDYYEEIG